MWSCEYLNYSHQCTWNWSSFHFITWRFSFFLQTKEKYGKECKVRSGCDIWWYCNNQRTLVLSREITDECFLSVRSVRVPSLFSAGVLVCGCALRRPKSVRPAVRWRTCARPVCWTWSTVGFSLLILSDTSVLFLNAPFNRTTQSIKCTSLLYVELWEKSFICSDLLVTPSWDYLTDFRKL